MTAIQIFQEITALLVVTVPIALLFRILRQPIILGYIFSGILLSGVVFTSFEGKEFLEAMSKIGITLLLFLLGLELKFSELRAVGRVAIITGIGQICFTVIIGMFITIALGYELVEAFIISLSITFSSTIVIVKLLSDKKELNTLHGKISVGFLLVQDFCAIAALVLLSGIGSNNSTVNSWEVLFLLAKAFFMFAVIVFLSQNVFPRVVRILSANNEIFFVSSIAWAFGFASFASVLGITTEIGGFLAGLALANSIQSTQILSKVKSLRDFFILIFFVSLGASLSFGSMNEILIPSIVLSAFVLFGNPIIVIIILRSLGYTLKTGFKSGLSVAQISEFSLILAMVGLEGGRIKPESLSMLTVVAIVTFVISSYMIIHSESLYNYIKPLLLKFEKKGFDDKQESTIESASNHVVLVGIHRMGESILNCIPRDDLILVDFDSEKVENLKEKGFKVVFGDISEQDVLERAKVHLARIVISTVPTVSDNLVLAYYLSSQKSVKPRLIVTTHSEKDKLDLINAGADEVILPYQVAGEFVASRLRDMLDISNKQ
ncbi:hypothetical protein D6810_03025 [Candidatus Dojkabacteria bacterium]|uniref:RCK N-terminal domain-containing protein n=1 Tax=Candidatus Dojkabacteria bacterium TaxID=2099670 RepID=A0A3M0YZL8_9BACT|nr:MAG: hypothetical protein D6810_03025 [Candidatus Dojkabacteria bacterium]